ncbi:beta strand repeat-containing protein [Helicobacter heilmannii]|uniref:beta strand repeat-containing protein n=1 Tax=Helicobacter heilmannii TaxID=35817 RepID=UPI0006B3B875|nr:hypothetical protein [Helicobacter heilmannii]
MKSRKKKTFKTTLSLALGAAFGLVPSLDATEVNVVNMVDSISGILGGNYNLNGSGVFSGPANASWGNASLGSITNPSGVAPSFGNGSLNNPSVTTNNLYGSSGLLNSYIGALPSSLTGSASTDQLGIYSLSAVNSLMQALQGNATAAYGARTAFGGVGANNNILDPNTAITNNYFSISNQGFGNKASVTGNLNASQIGSTYTTSQVNALAGGVYTNITQLTSAINTLDQNNLTSGSFATYSADLSTALGNLSSLGGQFVSASSGLNSALSGLASVISSASGYSLITNTTGSDGATKYTVADGVLNTLSAINQLNTDISGGIATNATTLNSNYVTVMQELGGANVVQNLQIIANGVLNTPLTDVTNSNAASTPTAAANLNAVLSTLSSMSGAQTAAQVQAALQGLVNPNTAYTTAGNKINNTAPMGDGYEAVYNAYTAVAGALTKLQTAFGTSNLGDTLIRALEVNQLLSTASSGVSANTNLSGAFSASSSFSSTSIGAAGLGQLFNAFNNGSSSDYGTLDTLLGKLASYLNTNNVDTAVGTTSDNIKVNNTTSGTSNYPVTGPASTSTTTSWITQRVANQSSYNAAYNTALGKLLGYAMSYNKNSTALGGMLSSSSLLGNVLSQGINNAAANVMFNSGATEATSTADALNGQANTLNSLKAIFNSEDLLNEYVGAITQNYSRSPANVQQSQASALSYLYNALNASAAQDGLIAQTKEAIANALNNNFLASNLPASALQTIDAMGLRCLNLPPPKPKLPWDSRILTACLAILRPLEMPARLLL